MTHVTSPLRRARRFAATAALLLAVAVPAALRAADTVESLGFDPTQLQESFFGAMRGWYNAPDVPAAVRALPAAQKVAAVNVLGTFAKAWFASDEFRKQYQEAYKKSKPRGFGMPSLNASALARAAMDKATGKQANPSALEKDPNAQLARRLQAFLDATRDVDYTAVTLGTGSSRHFESAANEAKPAEWKMCFRAGKETGEAMRAFAQGWLEELKK